MSYSVQRYHHIPNHERKGEKLQSLALVSSALQKDDESSSSLQLAAHLSSQEAICLGKRGFTITGIVNKLQ
jgi:hypothetical protein